MATCQQKQVLEPLSFEKSVPGREAFSLPANDCPPVVPASVFPAAVIRSGEVDYFPEMNESEVVRHFVRLSGYNYGVDKGFYPLGSCTMKYNPKINETAARIPAFVQTHPHSPASHVQGNLRIIWELEQYLTEITGLARATLQPAAGAHGELTGMMMIKAWHDYHEHKRTHVLVPDSAHGTNPATSALCGYQVTTLPSNERGLIDLARLSELMDDSVAAIMITNPNTLGLFEENICEVVRIVHERGGLVYSDGANMNAILGITRPGDMGVDVLHLNLHKTFSTPHGGGGPGAGPVAVCEKLVPYLPGPIVDKDEKGRFVLSKGDERSIGRVSSFFGNFGVLLRAYAYIRTMGADGLKLASEIAVLNANYVRQTLKPEYHIPYDRICKHECVFNDKIQLQHHVSTMDIAKRLIDYGFHPPTIYFPLIVKGALMIEPTETETIETIDQFVQTLKIIAREAEENPELVTDAPHCAPLRRLDDVAAARHPRLRYTPE